MRIFDALCELGHKNLLLVSRANGIRKFGARDLFTRLIDKNLFLGRTLILCDGTAENALGHLLGNREGLMRRQENAIK